MVATATAGRGSCGPVISCSFQHTLPSLSPAAVSAACRPRIEGRSPCPSTITPPWSADGRPPPQHTLPSLASALLQVGGGRPSTRTEETRGHSNARGCGDKAMRTRRCRGSPIDADVVPGMSLTLPVAMCGFFQQVVATLTVAASPALHSPIPMPRS